MNVNMTGVFLRKHLVFSGLNEEQLFEVSAAIRQNVLNKGHRITINPLQSNRIYFLIRGKMKVVGSVRDSNESIKDLIHVGEMFGNISLSDYAEEEYVEALVSSTVVFCIGVREFRDLLKAHHKLALNYSENISRKFNMLKERYVIWTKHDTKTRFIYLLNNWAKVDGEQKGNWIILHNYLSITDLADILSVSRQFMYILLKEMEKSGQIRYGRKQIELNISLVDNYNLN